MTNVPTATKLPMLQTYYHGKPIKYIGAETTWVTLSTSSNSIPSIKPLICQRCGAPMRDRSKCEYCETVYA